MAFTAACVRGFRGGLLVILTLALMSCSGIRRITDAAFHDGDVVEKPNYLDQEQQDHWLDGASNWRYWDVASPDNANVVWSYQLQAVDATMVASADLNRYARLSHPLPVRLIQLTDVSDLSRLLASPEGIKVVLNAPLEMIPNAVSIDDYTLIPNQTFSMRVPRQQDVQFFAWVSGYAGLDPATCCRIVTVPVISEPAPERDKSLFNALTFDLMASEEEKAQDELPDIVRPAVLRFNVVFADTGIAQFNVMAY